MPPRNPFANLFVESPMRPLQDHMDRVYETTAALVPFLQAAQAGDWKLARVEQKKIVKLEHVADKQKRSVRTHLPKSLFMPVSRSDLLELVSVQDHIANAAKDVSGLMLGRKMRFPEEIAEDFIAYAKANIDTAKQAMKAVKRLDHVLELGFSKRELQSVEKEVAEIEHLEHLTDKLQIKLRAKLHTIEENLNAVDVMFLYRIIDSLAKISDHAEKVGSRLQIVVAV
ncbi:TIGR00153 family protein [Halieaceae bacterium IMCC14734]|uniref:TIGR00153 family protein n=1 Tax=Candidatus Litorirhabdus singularis TaxID=2518993 RepID=A0ABT3TGS8_9GAMM|nr:TIGR00153 family protein [Candidatus Litorirhabdus singularis]MCX2981486.1 TIGR00153 family protein [Candidatus Litorirhabdus singularis]